MRRALVIAAVAVCALSTGVAGAVAKTVTAHEGTVAATLSYPDAAGEAGTQALPALTLEITRAGAQVYSQPVSSSYCAGGCGLESFGGGPLQVKDLEGNGEPAPVLELNSGGAHCCTIVQVFSFDPGVMAYRVSERDFGDPGAALVDLGGDGHLEFVSADDRFAYAFAPYAFSGLPRQIWSFREGRFVNVTRAFPAALESDARRQLRGFRETAPAGQGLGLLAAWAADEYLLGRRSLVVRTLAHQLRAGHLRSHGHYGPAGAAFIHALTRFLHRDGYA